MKTHVAFKKYFDRKKKTSPGFSMRSLARRLKISASFLSRMLNGKKPIPAHLLLPLAHALDIETEFLAGIQKVDTKTEVSSAFSDWEISEPQISQILRNWYYIPILDFITLSNFDGKVQSIAKRLDLSLDTAQVALRELESLGLIKVSGGRYVKTQNKLRITSSKSIPLIRKFHDEMLEKCQHILRHEVSDDAFQRRLITGITLTANPEAVQKAKKKLADFLYDLANDLINSPGTEVYHLSSQLFPLTKK